MRAWWRRRLNERQRKVLKQDPKILVVYWYIYLKKNIWRIWIWYIKRNNIRIFQVFIYINLLIIDPFIRYLYTEGPDGIQKDYLIYLLADLAVAASFGTHIDIHTYVFQSTTHVVHVIYVIYVKYDIFDIYIIYHMPFDMHIYVNILRTSYGHICHICHIWHKWHKWHV